MGQTFNEGFGTNLFVEYSLSCITKSVFLMQLYVIMLQMLIGETPSNPRISILDLEEFGKLGQEKGIVTMVDSTYASPYLQQPIKLGVDIVVHSA